MSEYKYQSPIEMIQSEMEMRVEGEIVKAVQDVGVNVDKDELLKALAYDRDQYNKGYNDGKPKVGEWIRTGRTNVYGGEELMCPFCGDRVMVQNIEYELYCRQCGALLGDRAKGEPMRDITVVPDDFIITHKKMDIVMDCTKDGDITYAVERTYTKLVRCKDCMENRINVDGVEECWCYHFGYETEPTDFCSYGERRADDSRRTD